MYGMKHSILILFLVFFTTISSFAKISVKEPCSNGMVLQQNSNPVVWGHASPGAKVQVKTGWNGSSYKAVADSDGVWKVNVSTPAASYTNYDIVVKGEGASIEIKDVLIGEVWIAAGQSNMEMPMGGWTNVPVENAIEYLSCAPMHDKIRMFTVEENPSMTPLDDVQKTRGWEKADSSTIPDMSATAFFFALKLNSVLDIPIGIVSIPRGATRVEGWLSHEIIDAYGTESEWETENRMKSPWAPYTSYNGMQHPVQGYTAKGFIWYQGCSNVHSYSTYAARLKDMVSLWRDEWGDTECRMPFYTVEIAPCAEEGGYNGLSPLLRKAQLEASKSIENCEMVCTNDLVYDYEIGNIHPCQKQPVGNRLAYIALNHDYGFDRLPCLSPEALKAYFDADNNLCVEFSNCSKGVNRTRGIEGLEICCEDGSIIPVDRIKFSGKGIMKIPCEGIDGIKYVRYGWGDFKPGNLKSAWGLPVIPFEIAL